MQLSILFSVIHTYPKRWNPMNRLIPFYFTYTVFTLKSPTPKKKKKIQLNSTEKPIKAMLSTPSQHSPKIIHDATFRTIKLLNKMNRR